MVGPRISEEGALPAEWGFKNWQGTLSAQPYTIDS